MAAMGHHTSSALDIKNRGVGESARVVPIEETPMAQSTTMDPEDAISPDGFPLGKVDAVAATSGSRPNMGSSWWRGPVRPLLARRGLTGGIHTETRLPAP